MKRTIQTTETVEKEVVVTICDHCGLEADDAVTVLADPEMAVKEKCRHEVEPKPAPYHEPKYPLSRVPNEARRVMEIDAEAEKEICRDCLDELF